MSLLIAQAVRRAVLDLRNGGSRRNIAVRECSSEGPVHPTPVVRCRTPDFLQIHWPLPDRGLRLPQDMTELIRKTAV
jgi:hypothetical protein